MRGRFGILLKRKTFLIEGQVEVEQQKAVKAPLVLGRRFRNQSSVSLSPLPL
jgi:hypothetical protein